MKTDLIELIAAAKYYGKIIEENRRCGTPCMGLHISDVLYIHESLEKEIIKQTRKLLEPNT